MSQAAKVLVIGPQKCGKTRLANFLTDYESAPNFDVYAPTSGVRILESERVIKVQGRSVRQQVRLRALVIAASSKRRVRLW
tara:strand:- start:2087 stop:2329 length:243 start_codon:yes stop_codon:yes gene_type:complete